MDIASARCSLGRGFESRHRLRNFFFSEYYLFKQKKEIRLLNKVFVAEKIVLKWVQLMVVYESHLYSRRNWDNRECLRKVQKSIGAKSIANAIQTMPLFISLGET